MTETDAIMQEAVAILRGTTERRRAELRARPEEIALRQGVDPDRFFLPGNPEYRAFLRRPDIVEVRARWASAVKAERAAKGMDPALDVDSYFPETLAKAESLGLLGAGADDD